MLPGVPVKPWLTTTPIGAAVGGERLGTGQDGHGVPRFADDGTGRSTDPSLPPSAARRRLVDPADAAIVFVAPSRGRLLRLGQHGRRRSSERLEAQCSTGS